MWCYQKPGFKAMLLTELQRQQQFPHFCDTMLKTEGIFKHLNLTFLINTHFGSLAYKAVVFKLSSPEYLYKFDPCIMIFPHLKHYTP